MTDAAIVPFRRKSYDAKLAKFTASGFTIHIAGTLDGFLDFAIVESSGNARIYQFTRDDARMIIAGLNATIEDIQANCLFDRDPLLMPDGRRE